MKPQLITEFFMSTVYAVTRYRFLFVQQMAIENERGNPANPLKISWLQKSPAEADNSTTNEVAVNVSLFYRATRYS